MIKDYIVGIGLDVLKDKVQEGISQNEIKHKLMILLKDSQNITFLAPLRKKLILKVYAIIYVAICWKM